MRVETSQPITTARSGAAPSDPSSSAAAMAQAMVGQPGWQMPAQKMSSSSTMWTPCRR